MLQYTLHGWLAHLLLWPSALLTSASRPTRPHLPPPPLQADLNTSLDALEAPHRAWAGSGRFGAKSGELCLLPGPEVRGPACTDTDAHTLTRSHAHTTWVDARIRQRTRVMLKRQEVRMRACTDGGMHERKHA